MNKQVILENKQEPELMCVLFPGIVKNEERAIQCLGGIRNISQVYSQATKKGLGLSFHPDNPFVKKVNGDVRKTAGILLKVKVKKTKNGGEVKREVVSTSVIGKVKQVHKFDSLADFQFLPLKPNKTGSMECFAEKILPSGVDKLDFIKAQDCPMFIVPSCFTRTDKPYNYAYTDKKYIDKIETADKDCLVHRRSRGTPLLHYNFNLSNEMPTEPQEYYVKQRNLRMIMYPQLKTDFETVKKIFDERPICSLAYIKYNTKLRLFSLKVILPCLAVFLRTGPWKKTWARFGYDPRKHPEARRYQTLDVRVRHTGGLNAMVTTRGQFNHQLKVDRDRRIEKSAADEAPYEEVFEGAVYFRPGIMPAQRQIYYQYCDIQLPEVEELLAVDPPPGYLCHLMRGWLAPNTDQLCRDYIFKYMKEELFSNSSADMKLEQDSNNEESNSDDDGDAEADADADADVVDVEAEDSGANEGKGNV